MRLRMTNSLRSSAGWSGVWRPRPMKIWRISGRFERASGQHFVSSIGTARQPSTRWPSSRMIPARPRRNSALDIGRQKDQADAVLARRRQRHVDPLADFAQERIGHLNDQPGPVAGQRVAPAGAAMRQVLQDGQALLHDGVRLDAVEVGDEADAAGVVLEAWVIEPLSFQSSPCALHDARPHSTRRFGLQHQLGHPPPRAPLERLLRAQAELAFRMRRQHHHGLGARHALDRA